MSSNICSSGAERDSSYTCYDETFDVSYTIFDGRMITSTIKTHKVVNQRDVQVKIHWSGNERELSVMLKKNSDGFYFHELLESVLSLEKKNMSIIF